MNSSTRLDGAARWGLYVFAFSLVFWPLADLILNVWPLQPGNVQWRYGFAGLLSSFLHTPMLGLVLALGVAWTSGHGGVLKGLGFLQIAAALVILGLVLLFTLDLLQVRASRPPDSLPALFVGGITAAGKYLLVMLALALMGRGALRMAARMTRAESRSPQPGGVVMEARASGGADKA